jgi:hypothetical protein
MGFESVKRFGKAFKLLEIVTSAEMMKEKKKAIKKMIENKV